MRRLAIVLVCALFVVPLAFLVSVSLHPEGEGLGAGLFAFPDEPAFDNYAAALERMGSGEGSQPYAQDAGGG